MMAWLNNACLWLALEGMVECQSLIVNLRALIRALWVKNQQQPPSILNPENTYAKAALAIIATIAITMIVLKKKRNSTWRGIW